ncbi:hypothetical protein [Nocardia wallacei]|uniref:hypothetical protein n=1 Tax=Nocardia wallacei TaxID=480035 RepID=UPI0024554B42|nr:hypothetical protein [Nocardia wallacei]
MTDIHSQERASESDDDVHRYIQQSLGAPPDEAIELIATVLRHSGQRNRRSTRSTAVRHEEVA